MDIQNSCIGVKKDCGKIVTFVRYCSPHFSLLSYFFILLGYEGMFYCISVSLKVANIFSLIWCNINYLNKNLVNNTCTWWIIPVLQSHSSVQSLSTKQTSGLESHFSWAPKGKTGTPVGYILRNFSPQMPYPHGPNSWSFM